MNRRHARAALLMGIITLAAGLLAACGDDPGAPPHDPKPHARTELTAHFNDPGGKPSSEFLDSIDALVDGQDSQADLDACPFGDPSDFDAHLIVGNDEGRAWQEIRMVVGSRIDGPSSVFCNRGWLQAYATKADRRPSTDEAIAGVWDGTGSVFSEPELFLGGRAFTFRYVNQRSGQPVVGVGWLYENYFVHWMVFSDSDPDPQKAADWFSQVFPSMVGAHRSD